MSGSTLAAAAFGGYALLGRLAAPLVRHYLRRRLARGREDAARLPERLGTAGKPRPEGPLIWVHGASVGEAVAALPLIDRLRETQPDFALLMTTGTVTSARLMAERLPAGVIHQFVPVDMPQAVEAFLDHWRPQAGLFIESEFWPNLLRSAAARGTKLILLNGRVSADSYQGWQRARPLIAELLGCFSLILARSAEDHGRLLGLGAAHVECLGDLKAAAPPLRADPVKLEDARRLIAGRTCWLAASTHRGEERMAGDTHRALKGRHPGLLTLLVPRHPARAPEIRRDLEGLGLNVTQRSRNEAVAAATDIYLADSIGELGLWYRLAEVVLMGGSLVPHGGQNLLEPAKLDCAIVTGPHTGNFTQRVAEMSAAGALREVGGPAELTNVLDELLRDSCQRQTLAVAAQHYAAGEAGVLERVMAAISPLLREVRAKPD